MPAAYTFDLATGRYRDPAGALVAPAAVHAAAAALQSRTLDEVAVLSQRLADGDLSAAAWEAQMATTLRDAHLTATALAVGGWAQLPPYESDLVDRLTGEFEYLAGFRAALPDLSDAQQAARATLYAQGVWATYQQMRGALADQSGMDEERSVTDPAAASCAECDALEADDWVPLGTLPEVGERECLSNCRCGIEYRSTADQGVEELALAGAVAKYSDDQPRDDHGRWTDAGGSSASAAHSGLPPLVPAIGDGTVNLPGEAYAYIAAAAPGGDLRDERTEERVRDATAHDLGMRVQAQLGAASHFADAAAASAWLRPLLVDWGNSARSPSILGLHEAVRQKFDLPAEAMRGIAIIQPTPEQRALVDAIYANTQAHLAGAGVTALMLARGARVRDTLLPPGIVPDSDPGQRGQHENAPAMLAPLSSWTGSSLMAGQFTSFLAQAPRDASVPRTRVQLTATVPAARIFSTGRTGLGEPRGSEYVVIGGPSDVRWHTFEAHQGFVYRRPSPAPAPAPVDEDPVSADWLHIALKREPLVDRAFNPDQPRDDHGRWTDAGGGGSASAAAATTPLWTPDPIPGREATPRDDPAYAAHARALEQRIGDAPAKEAAARAEAYLADHARQAHQMHLSVDLAGLPAAHAVSVAAEIARWMDAYPTVASSLESVTFLGARNFLAATDRGNGNSWASTQKGDILLNGKQLGPKSFAPNERHELEVTSGWAAAGLDGVRGIIAHELGHVTENHLLLHELIGLLPDGVKADHAALGKVTPSHTLSHYARSSSREAFAEAFAQRELAPRSQWDPYTHRLDALLTGHGGIGSWPSLSQLGRNVSRAYNPDEPRDDHGRWTDDGGSAPADATAWFEEQASSVRAEDALQRRVADALGARIEALPGYDAERFAAWLTPPSALALTALRGWQVAADSAQAGLLQSAVAEQFHLPAASRDQLFAGQQALSPTQAYQYGLLAQAIHAETQAYLSARGVEAVNLYRGESWHPDQHPPAASASRNVTLAPLSSWTTTAADAGTYALRRTEPGRQPVVLSAAVPASRIFSTPMTGIGGYLDREIVVLGGSLPVQVQPVVPGHPVALRAYNPDQPRLPAGGPGGGEWTSGGGSEAALGTQPPGGSLSEVVHHTEALIAHQPIEHLYAFDDQGRVVYYEAGDKHSVGQTGASNYEPRFQHATLLHNHPTVDNPGGSGLSEADVYTAIRHDAKAMIAVTTTHRYIAERPAAGWPDLVAFKQAVLNARGREEKKREVRYQALMQQPGADQTAAGTQRAWHESYRGFSAAILDNGAMRRFKIPNRVELR